MNDTATAEDRVPAEVHETVGLLMQVTRRTRQRFEEAAAQFDLSPAHARALLELRRGVPMRALAAVLGCDASNVTGIADRLEARDLVRRVPGEHDRRVKVLTLTEQGARVRSALESAVAQSSPVMTALTAEDRRVLRDLLRKAAGPS